MKSDYELFQNNLGLLGSRVYVLENNLASAEYTYDLMNKQKCVFLGSINRQIAELGGVLIENEAESCEHCNYIDTATQLQCFYCRAINRFPVQLPKNVELPKVLRIMYVLKTKLVEYDREVPRLKQQIARQKQLLRSTIQTAIEKQIELPIDFTPCTCCKNTGIVATGECSNCNGIGYHIRHLPIKSTKTT